VVSVVVCVVVRVVVRVVVGVVVAVVVGVVCAQVSKLPSRYAVIALPSIVAMSPQSTASRIMPPSSTSAVLARRGCSGAHSRLIVRIASWSSARVLCWSGTYRMYDSPQQWMDDANGTWAHSVESASSTATSEAQSRLGVTRRYGTSLIEAHSSRGCCASVASVSLTKRLAASPAASVQWWVSVGGRLWASGPVRHSPRVARQSAPPAAALQDGSADTSTSVVLGQLSAATGVMEQCWATTGCVGEPVGAAAAAL